MEFSRLITIALIYDIPIRSGPSTCPSHSTPPRMRIVPELQQLQHHRKFNSTPPRPFLMPVSIFPEPSGNVQDEPQGDRDLKRPLTSVALISRDVLSDIPELASDTSSQDALRLPLDRSAGAIMQLIRDSAHEILESTGGPSPYPTLNTAADLVDDNSHVQNISRISDDIVRNLARIFDLRPDNINQEMSDTAITVPQALTPAITPSAGLLRARHPSLRRRRSRQVCRDCQSTVTPKWRCGPHGPATLCNVCGLLYAKRMGIEHGLHDG